MGLVPQQEAVSAVMDIAENTVKCRRILADTQCRSAVVRMAAAAVEVVCALPATPAPPARCRLMRASTRSMSIAALTERALLAYVFVSMATVGSTVKWHRQQ